MKKLYVSWLLIFFIPVLVLADDSDYTQGIFFINEGWYGHENSTVNYLLPEEDDPWTYRVFQKENDGQQLGCTSQFGTIYGDKFYIVSKQDKDPGASVSGSRLAVCDAKTMKCLKAFPYIATDDDGKSIADGRSFLGVDEHTGYIGTSNGIWLYDIDNMEIGEQIEGTGNPSENGYGQLYYAQVGTMLRAGDKVFAIHQANGIMVIDALSHVLDTIIEGTYGSIIQSLDESLWVSVAANASGSGATMPYLIQVNPYTLETDTLHIPDGVSAPGNSWYAWTADGLTSSTTENKIYWEGKANNNSWFKASKIYCYDIDNDEFAEIFDFAAHETGWNMYGASFRIHPVTNEIYAFMYKDFNSNNYRIGRLTTEGELLREYELISHYWFPALPVFPDNYAPEIADIPEIVFEESFEPYILPLSGIVTDADNLDAAIVKSVSAVSNPELFAASVVNGQLVVTPVEGQFGEGTITLKANSNGKIVEKNISVSISSGSGIESYGENQKVYTHNENLYIENCQGYTIHLYNMAGHCLYTFYVDNDNHTINHNLPNGMYIYRGTKDNHTINGKIIIR